jgi:hypothetical protein
VIVSDSQPWACANDTLKQYGEDASIFAAKRAEKLLELADLDGANNWLILDRIEQILAKPEGALQ